MLIRLIAVLWILPTTVFAQSMQGMSQADMQKMMEGAQKMQACMMDVDQTALQSLEARSKKVEADIKSACESGQRDKAMDTAKDFAAAMMNDVNIQKMKKCSEMMADMMQHMPQMPLANFDDYKDRHVCDHR